MERRTLLRVGAAVAAVVLLLVVWMFVGGDGSDDDPGPSTNTAQQSNNGEQSDDAGDSANSTTKPTPKPKDLDPEPTLTEKQDIGSGGWTQIKRIEAVQSQAQMRGEVSAPAVRVTVEVRAGDEPLDLGSVLVNAYWGKDLVPAVDVSGPGVEPFSGTLKAKSTATGVYVFNVPEKERGNVTFEIIHPNSVKSLLLQGFVS